MLADCLEISPLLERAPKREPLRKVDSEAGLSPFKYINCMSSICLDENISSVVFDISRGGKYTHTIYFEKALAETHAIAAAEKFLSQPLTEDYYNAIKDDLLNDDMPWEEAQFEYEHRGACLKDCYFLENATYHHSTLTLHVQV